MTVSALASVLALVAITLACRRAARAAAAEERAAAE